MVRYAVFLSLVGALAMGAPPAVAASDMPRYDVDAYCHKIAAAVGSSAAILNTCMDSEQESYDNLKGMWATVPAKTQKYCNDISKAVGGSYSIMETCVETELEEAAKPRTFKY